MFGIRLHSEIIIEGVQFFGVNAFNKCLFVAAVIVAICRIRVGNPQTVRKSVPVKWQAGPIEDRQVLHFPT